MRRRSMTALVNMKSAVQILPLAEALNLDALSQLAFGDVFVGNAWKRTQINLESQRVHKTSACSVPETQFVLRGHL